MSSEARPGMDIGSGDTVDSNRQAYIVSDGYFIWTLLLSDCDPECDQRICSLYCALPHEAMESSDRIAKVAREGFKCMRDTIVLGVA